MSRKTRRQLLGTLGSGAALAVAGCSSDGGSTGTTTTTETGTTTTGETTTAGSMASVRVAHLSPDAPNVDVYVDGSAVLEDVAYETVSGYLSVATGSHDVKITAAGDESTVVYDQSVELAANNYTLAAVGELNSDDSEFQVLSLVDDVSDPGSSNARVKLVHASPDAPAVDVTLASNGTAIFDNVSFTGASTTTVAGGSYTLDVRANNENNDGAIQASFPVSPKAGGSYTVFAIGYLSPGDEDNGESFKLKLVRDDGDTMTTVEPNPSQQTTTASPMASVRVAHLSPDAPNVDVYVDGSVVLEDVAYETVGSYLSVSTGDRDIKITAAGDESTVVYDQTLTLSAKNYTLAAVGENSSSDTDFQVLSLVDDLSDPGSGDSRIKLLHASPDAPAVDVTLASNDSVVFDNVSFTGTSETTVASGDYTLDVRANNENNDGAIQDSFPVSPKAGASYTAFAIGYLTPGDESTDESFTLKLVRNDDMDT